MISSTSNPTVKLLTQLRERRGRAAQGQFLIEGARLLEEALASAIPPTTILLSPQTLRATARGRALHDRLLHAHGLPDPLEVTPAVLRHVADTETPSGVVAALSLPPAPSLEALPARAGLALVLDGVRDPGNAGAILRTAHAAAVDAVVALDGCVDLYAPKVVRAAMGAHFRLTLATEIAAQSIGAWLQQRGQAILADASSGASLYDVDLRPPTVLVVGGEAHGAPHAAAMPYLRPVTIPMPGGAESLNAAIATAVILFEALRQRSATGSHNGGI